MNLFLLSIVNVPRRILQIGLRHLALEERKIFYFTNLSALVQWALRG